MAAPYSTDLRLKVLTAYDRGFATAQIAEMFSVSPSWARRVKQRRRECGEVEPRPMGGARKIKIDRERLAQLVAKQPDATLAELRDRIEVECSRSGVEKALKSLDLTLKKRRWSRRNRIVLTSSSNALDGRSSWPRSMRGGSSSSTKRGRKRT